MQGDPTKRTTVVVYAPATAFASGAQTALTHLGYNLVGAGTAERQLEKGVLHPMIRLVDDRQLAELPLESPLSKLPMILLTDESGSAVSDPRAFGSVRRRAGLRDVYELLQRALEERPRSVPRVHDAIPVECSRDGRSWTGAIRSISEKGCLLQSWQEVEPDLRVDLAFPLANRGVVHVPAQPSYREGKLTGMIFRGTTATQRSILSDYVSRRLSG